MLRVGRINSRALQGPIRLPVDKKELLQQVENTYKAWFRVFKEVMVPRLIHQPKWFKIDKDLKQGDLVYFQKTESALSSPWTIGQVDQIITSRDGLIRRAIVKYFNATENFPRFSDRAVRKLVKLWSLEDSCLFEDLSEVDRRLGEQGGGQDEQHQGAHSQPVRSKGYDPVDMVPQGLGQHQGYYATSAPLSGSGEAASTTTISCDLNLGPLSLPCELDVLVMKEQLEADECDIDTEEELSDLDTLHSILVSTSLSLE